jgi:hypothetical protein
MAKRTSVVRIRVTAEERDAIIDAAEAIGLGLCSFARMATVKAAGRKPTKPPRRKPNIYVRALAGWTAQLGWLGNNLNQCTRVLNGGGSVDPDVLAGIRAELAQLREVIVAFDREAE